MYVCCSHQASKVLTDTAVLHDHDHSDPRHWAGVTLYVWQRYATCSMLTIHAGYISNVTLSLTMRCTLLLSLCASGLLPAHALLPLKRACTGAPKIMAASSSDWPHLAPRCCISAPPRCCADSIPEAQM